MRLSTVDNISIEAINSMHDAIQEIYKSLKIYFDALYLGDVEMFRSIFHPQARLFSADGDKLIEMDVNQYLALVAGRPSPASRRDKRHEEILSISIPTKSTAHARVRELFQPKLFTDELTFLFLNGEWKIISKVWHFDPAIAE